MVVSAGNFPVLVHHAVLCNLHPLGCFSTHLFAEALQAAGKIRPVPVYLVKISGCWLVVVVVCKRDCPIAFSEIRIGQLAEIPPCYHVVILLLRNGGRQFSFAAGAPCPSFQRDPLLHNRMFRECVSAPECTMPAPFTSSFRKVLLGFSFLWTKHTRLRRTRGIQRRAGLSKFPIPSSPTDPPSFSPPCPPLSPACSSVVARLSYTYKPLAASSRRQFYDGLAIFSSFSAFVQIQ